MLVFKDKVHPNMQEFLERNMPVQFIEGREMLVAGEPYEYKKKVEEITGKTTTVRNIPDEMIRKVAGTKYLALPNGWRKIKI